MAEMYVHGKLSAKDFAPVKDLLKALVAGDLSGPRAPGGAHSRGTVQEATNKFLDAAGVAPDREQERFVRQQFAAWRERGEPIPLEEIRPPLRSGCGGCGGYRPCRVQSRHGGYEDGGNRDRGIVAGLCDWRAAPHHCRQTGPTGRRRPSLARWRDNLAIASNPLEWIPVPHWYLFGSMEFPNRSGLLPELLEQGFSASTKLQPKFVRLSAAPARPTRNGRHQPPSSA
jgi:hypothetical protein